MTRSLWYVRETEAAVLYSKLPTNRNPDQGDFLWVPKSIIEHRTKHPADGKERPMHDVKLPDWFVEKEGL